MRFDFALAIFALYVSTIGAQVCSNFNVSIIHSPCSIYVVEYFHRIAPGIKSAVVSQHSCSLRRDALIELLSL
jgi:hypothetical protein